MMAYFGLSHLSKTFLEPTSNYVKNSDVHPKEKTKKIRKKKSKKPTYKDKYRKIKTIGSGAFGSVHLVRCKITNTRYAIKETFQDPKFVNREGEMCKKLNSPYIVRCHEILYEERSKLNKSKNTSFLNRKNNKREQQVDGTWLIVIMDFYPYSLQNIIDRKRKSDTYLDEYNIKLYSYQILKGLQYMHELGIAHRDIKPDNILVCENGGRAVIADLGSAKNVNEGYNKSYICSRVYRAPELTLGCQHYTTNIDVWSFGCVLIELYKLESFFQVRSNESLFKAQEKLLGYLSDEEKRKLIDGDKFDEPVRVKNTDWIEETKITNHPNWLISQKLHNFIYTIFQYDSTLRTTAKKGLEHDYFALIATKEIG